MTPAERDRRLADIHAHAVGLAQEGRYSMALAAFEQALALKPDSVDTLFNIGACHEALGDPMLAVRIYRRILDVTPNDPDCYANLGTSYMKMYHRENSPVWRKMAREAWRRSLALKPDQPDIQAFLAQSESID